MHPDYVSPIKHKAISQTEENITLEAVHPDDMRLGERVRQQVTAAYEVAL